MLITPLAAKLCAARGINPGQLRGSGPRGRIMAADVAAAAAAPAPAGGTHMAQHALQPTRAEKDGYYVYDDEVNMRALADISLPIAVQCEKLLERRYSLFDYIVRAVVKACMSVPEWRADSGAVDALLFEGCGEQIAAIPDCASKSIYRIARESQPAAGLPAGYHPHIIVCDAQTTRAQVAERLSGTQRPAFAFVVRDHSPKVGIRIGHEGITSYRLPYTFYAAADRLPAPAANRIAAELHALLFNPVRLLLLS